MAITETTDTTSVSGKIIKKFTSDINPTITQARESFIWICPSGVNSIEYLLVAGGGSGAWGGGGGGGMLEGTIAVEPGVEYTFEIGCGALPHSVGNYGSYNGGNSIISGPGITTVTALGGGGGGGLYGHKPGNSGGSGGGGGDSSGAGGAGTPGQGNNGGVGPSKYVRGGGGGGAGSSGGTAGSGGGNGGNGRISTITGESVLYAGGGGGVGSSGGTAGSGGGGGGCPTYEYNVYSNGTDGLGGGGGGTYVSKDARDTAYGRGGSGVVILRYDAPTILVSARQFNVSGSGNLLVMEVQT